ncbi:MAG: hypothetical protein LBV30_09640, partial [Propionibacteriaceae bacterium]|nr:hypothetical protein [Propionibacteriaceae bacterium]
MPQELASNTTWRRRRPGPKMVVATITSLALFATTALLGTDAYAAQTNDPRNISTVTQTTSDASRAYNWDAATVRANMNMKGSPDAPSLSTSTDPTGQQYVNLAQQGQTSIFRYAFLKQEVSANQDFTVEGYFNPDRLVDNNQDNHGDWVGVVLIPKKWDQVDATPSYGGGLGIYRTPNAIAAGIDMNLNNEYNDGMWGPNVTLRWTGADGNLDNHAYCDTKGLCSRQETANQDIRAWGTTVKYTLKYFYNGGKPYIIYTATDSSNAAKTFTVNTQTAGVTLNVPADGVFTVGVNAVNGPQNNQGFRASIDTLQGSVGTYQGTINYLVDPTIVAGGGTVAPSTTLSGLPGDKVGITGKSAGAIAGTDTYAYDGAVPDTDATVYKTGWHLNRVTDKAGTASDLTYQMVAADNVLNLYYAPDYQQARLETDASDPTGAKTVSTLDGRTGSGITNWPDATDAKLARAGYVYTVTFGGKTYDTLAAAQVGAVFDATPNGSATTDATPQVFLVKYVIDPAIMTAANKALTDAQTSNVISEPTVKAAEQALKDAMNATSPNPQTIQDATKALNDAVAAAKPARDAAIAAANQANTAASNSSAATDPTVKAAQDTLNNVLKNPDATTQQIKDATNALNNAVNQATANLAASRDTAEAALADTKPVSNEPAVADAVNKLNTVLASPDSTTDQIAAATKTLTDATGAAKAARDAANQAAQASIDAAKSGPTATDPAVQERIANLQQVMASAANDSPTDLTRNIVALTDTLKAEVAAKTGERDQAVADAKQALTQTAPVSHEP